MTIPLQLTTIILMIIDSPLLGQDLPEAVTLL